MSRFHPRQAADGAAIGFTNSATIIVQNGPTRAAAVAASTPTATSASSEAITTNPATEGSMLNNLQFGIIIGAVLIVGILIGGCIALLFMRRRRKNQETREQKQIANVSSETIPFVQTPGDAFHTRATSSTLQPPGSPLYYADNPLQHGVPYSPSSPGHRGTSMQSMQQTGHTSYDATQFNRSHESFIRENYYSPSLLSPTPTPSMIQPLPMSPTPDIIPMSETNVRSTDVMKEYDEAPLHDISEELDLVRPLAFSKRDPRPLSAMASRDPRPLSYAQSESSYYTDVAGNSPIGEPSIPVVLPFTEISPTIAQPQPVHPNMYRDAVLSAEQIAQLSNGSLNAAIPADAVPASQPSNFLRYSLTRDRRDMDIDEEGDSPTIGACDTPIMRTFADVRKVDFERERFNMTANSGRASSEVFPLPPRYPPSPTPAFLPGTAT